MAIDTFLSAASTHEAQLYDMIIKGVLFNACRFDHLWFDT